MAVDDSRLWISDYRNNTVKIYDKTTGLPIKNNAGTVVQELKNSTIVGAPGFNAPLGIAIQSSSPTSGTLWVAYKASGAPDGSKLQRGHSCQIHLYR